jgi:predicted PurR-regulated permease PerM
LPTLTPSKRNRLILVAVITIILLWVFYTARKALLPFIAGFLIGYVILPLVNFLDTHMVVALRSRKLSRALSILIVYLMVVLVIAVIVAFLIPILSEQVQTLEYNMPYLISHATNLLRDWLEEYQGSLPIDVDLPIDLERIISDNLTRLSTELGQTVQGGVKQTITVVTNTITFILGIVLIPIWLFYVLLDETKARRTSLALVPRANRPDARNIYTIVDNVLGSYFRGQFLLGASIGITATISLVIIGVEPALLLGIMAGILEFLPYIGPLVTLLVAGFIALIQSPIQALWTVVAFLIIQQLESNLLAPQVTSNSVRLHPAIVIFAIVVGNEIAGIWGMLLIVPITAVSRDVIRYLFLRFSDVEVRPDEALAQVQGREEPTTVDLPMDISFDFKEG